MSNKTAAKALEALAIDPRELPATVVDVPVKFYGSLEPIAVLTSDGRVPGYKPRPKIEELGIGSLVLIHSRGRVREAVVYRVGRSRISTVYNTPTDVAAARLQNRAPYSSTMDLPIVHVIAGAPETLEGNLVELAKDRKLAQRVIDHEADLTLVGVVDLVDRLEGYGAVGLGEKVLDSVTKRLDISRADLFAWVHEARQEAVDA